MMKLFFIMIVAGLLMLTTPVLAAENLLENPGFEEPIPAGDTDDSPIGWWSWNSDYNGTTADASRTGKYSVYFIGPPGGEAQTQGIVFTFKNVEPDKEYVFSVYAMNSKKDSIKERAYGQISIEWRKDNEEIDRAWGPTWGVDLSCNKWKLCEMTAIAPKGTDECFFVITFFAEDGSGMFYIDDAVAVGK